MTLIVAGISDGVGWIVADTAVSGGIVSLRERPNVIKLGVVGDFGIAGFAGDLEHGQRALTSLLEATDPTELLEVAKRTTRSHSGIDLLVLFVEDGRVRLFKINDKGVSEQIHAYIGDRDAFEKFQEIRHRSLIDHAPNALHQMVWSSYLSEHVPQELCDATIAMYALFSERTERDVGGFILPFMVGADGPALASFGYNVSDPIADVIEQGSIIPHGTAENGGFSFSITSLQKNAGFVIYWLQRRTGTIFLRTPSGYSAHTLSLGISEFLDAGERLVGQPIDLWFSDEPPGVPQSIRIIKDENGNARMAIADDGKHLSFSRTGVVTEGPFKSSTDISSTLTNADLLTDGFTTAGGERVDVEQIDAATIALLVPGLSGVLTLTAPDIDNMIQVLGYLRTSMSPGISRDWPPSTRILAAADPLWRVEPSPHQSAPGALVSFRHPSFGWVNYLIPPQELNGLSSWLGTFAAKSNADGK